MKKYIVLVAIFISFSGTARSQVLISLLFGDKLNSDKIEFGLTGGLNRTNFIGTLASRGLNNFNLGFYFHIRMKENSFISTGVLVKSNLGATGMTPYSLNDPNLDAVFQEGNLKTKINIFLVPIMWQQRINQRILLEGGFQTGLRARVYDFFDSGSTTGEATFRREVSEEYSRLDFGLIGGAGYKLKNELKSMSVGFLYYYGLVDMRLDPAIKSQNTSLNIYLRIPIGANKQ